MEIKIDLKTDSDNTYCDGKTLNITSRPRMVIIELESPYRKVMVEREDLKKVLSII